MPIEYHAVEQKIVYLITNSVKKNYVIYKLK